MSVMESGSTIKLKRRKIWKGGGGGEEGKGESLERERERKQKFIPDQWTAYSWEEEEEVEG